MSLTSKTLLAALGVVAMFVSCKPDAGDLPHDGVEPMCRATGAACAVCGRLPDGHESHSVYACRDDEPVLEWCLRPNVLGRIDCWSCRAAGDGGTAGWVPITRRCEPRTIDASIEDASDDGS